MTGPSRVAAQTIKKRASAQILAGSKLPEKKEISGGFEAPSWPLSSSYSTPSFSLPCPSLPAPNAMDRSSRLLFQGKNPHHGERSRFSDKKLAGVANVSTLNHIFIATLIQPFQVPFFSWPLRTETETPPPTDPFSTFPSFSASPLLLSLLFQLVSHPCPSFSRHPQRTTARYLANFSDSSIFMYRRADLTGVNPLVYYLVGGEPDS